MDSALITMFLDNSMTREKAIKIIKEFINGTCLHLVDQEALKTLIPELRENEDERIREDLIDGLMWQRDNLETIGPHDNNNILPGFCFPVSEHLAYLEKQKEQKPIKMEVYEVGKGTTVCGQDYKCKKDYMTGTCRYIKDAIYHCSRDGYLNDQNGVSWSCSPEWFKEYIQSNAEWAEEEKTRFVSGQFLQCKLSFDEFKEGEHYWLEYVGDDMYVGRSDNILNQKFHITPRQLYTLFSQQLEEVQGPPQEEKQASLNYEPPFDENPSDRKIIEALIKHLKEQDGFLTAIDSVSTKAILNRLEKMKEQKPGEWSEEEYGRLFDIEHYLDGTLQLSPDRRIACIDFIKSLRPQPKQEWSEDFDKEVENVHKRYPEVSFAKLTRIAYHFSKWANRYKNVEWSEEDDKMCNNILNVLTPHLVYSVGKGTYTGTSTYKYDNEIKWLKSLSSNLKKKNEDMAKLCSNEWSEEDKKILNELITIMDGGKVTSGTYLSEYVAWLKSFPERFNLKPNKQEWSEEDEGELQNAIDALEFLGKKGVYKSESGYDAALQAASWLKLFRFPFKDKEMKLKIFKYLSTRCSSLEFEEVEDYLNNLRPHWKPSEEQMDALRDVIETVPMTCRQQISLESLNSDLKKL